MPGNASEAERLYELVKELHGAGLTDEQLEQVRQRIDTVVETGEALRASPLDNADEPFIVFAPHDTKAADGG
jgi:hypothetical protein